MTTAILDLIIPGRRDRRHIRERLGIVPQPRPSLRERYGSEAMIGFRAMVVVGIVASVLRG